MGQFRGQLHRWTIVQRSHTLSGMRCVFCLSSDPPSRFTIEHVFPEAVGGTLTVPFVCKDCNDRLGHSVDVTVTDHTAVAISRQRLGITGKSGALPNPFERASLAKDPTHRVRLDFAKPEEERIYVLPFVERKQTGSGAGTLRVRVDARDADQLGGIINKALKRAGANPLTPEAIDELARDVAHREQPHLDVHLSFDLSEFRRGLAKIVYELACLWLGESYVDDPIADVLRQFIFDSDLPFDVSTRYRLRGAFRMAQGPFFPSSFWPDERGHLMACMPNPNQLTIGVSVLGMLDAMLCVSEDPSRYPARQSRFISINPQTGARRESTFEQEVVRICAQGWTENE